MTEMITETVPDSDVVGGTTRIIDLIAALTAKLEMIPEEFRASATLEICAYDWDGSSIKYERPVTEAEITERAERVEAQRQRAAKVADAQTLETWLRNIRISVIPDRDEAMEFLRTNTDANRYHPEVFRVAKTSPSPRPWAVAE